MANWLREQFCNLVYLAEFICAINIFNKYDVYVNCNWVTTRWQYFSTHIHTNNTENNTKQTIHKKHKTNNTENTKQTIHRTTQNKQYIEHKTNNTENNTKQTIHTTTQNKQYIKNTKQTIHRTTQNKQYIEHKTNNTENNTKQTIHRTTQKLGRVRAVPRL
jgi:primosomal protein N'